MKNRVCLVATSVLILALMAIGSAEKNVTSKESQIKEEGTAHLCTIVLIDKSGSMGMGRDDSKIKAVRRAVEDLLNQLKPNDMLGVISFDEHFNVLVPLGLVDNEKKQILERVRMIKPGGGTQLSSVLEETLRQMKGSSYGEKHTILITDGRTKDLKGYDYRSLLRDFRANGITISPMGLVEDTDSEFLRAIAMGTKGRYYSIKDVSTLSDAMLQDIGGISENSASFKNAPPLKKAPSTTGNAQKKQSL